MRLNLLGLLLILMIASCATQPKVIVDKNNATVTKPKNINPNQLIIGKWKMESYQVYTSKADPTENKNIVWEFKNNNEVMIKNMKGQTESMNINQYWMNKSIINVNGQLYMYYFEEPLGIMRMDDAKPFGDELWLDSNLDPSISDHGPKIHFTRIR